jgi:hypothetical protein
MAVDQPRNRSLSAAGTHQLADHRHGQRQREVEDEIGRVPLGEPVQQAVCDPLHHRPHRPHLPGGEGSVNEVTQPGVIWRVAVEHVHDLGADLGAADAAILDLPCPPGVLLEPRVCQRAAHVAVPGYQPDRCSLVVSHDRH